MRKTIIITIQVITFLIGIALLWVHHPMAYLASFILVFSAYDSFMWYYVFKDVYNTDKKDWKVISYRISQILIQVFFLVWGWHYRNWLVGCSTIVVWFMGFADLFYHWLNWIKVDDYLPWMTGWSVHLPIKLVHNDKVIKDMTSIIKWPSEKVLRALSFQWAGEYEFSPFYNCPRSWFLTMAYIGLGLSVILNVVGQL